ncbi:MAG: NitT/TauT family transport system ATP-binding protein [Variibacter sp.]|jgi:NitT/TauT family transport system ATP-binding protein|nr:NitT/TauT family transport system ATP-binding protein [Variibacter sp.]
MTEGDTAEPLVTLRGINKTFPNGITALDQFDFAVRQGEFVALLGPSGCGKSTALRLIAGLAEPSRGEITWSQGLSNASRSRIGFVFQDATLMPWATVARNVALPLRLAGETDAAAVVMPLLEQVGLAGFANAYPRELSGGMRMRVSLARALASEPRLLLMDEPFAALDEITRFRLDNDLLALWRARGMTVVFVTHSVFESVYLAQRILVMTPRPGRFAAEIVVDTPQPRDESFRTSAEYASYCRRTLQALEAAMSSQTSPSDEETRSLPSSREAVGRVGEGEA